MAGRLAKKLLIVGWDGADWQIAKELMDRGQMPALSGLVAGGVMGNLSGMQPLLSPMLWTTMATGKAPHDHGICGFFEPDQKAESGVRLAASSSRRCRAFWNILSDRKIHTNLVGWYVSHPVEEVSGCCVSDLFAKPVAAVDKPWPVPADSVYPESLAASFADLRIHPQEISLEQLEYFVPRAGEVGGTDRPALQKLAIALAECATHQAIATAILETQPWEVLAVYFNTLDHICHDFMYFHPPRMDHIPQQQFDLFGEVVNNSYRFHDMLLSRLLHLAGEDATVMLVSDHGYLSGPKRPRLTPGGMAGPAAWHRPFGMFALRGPGIRADELVFGARQVDITPTILTLMGLPVGRDMAGRALTQVFEKPFEPELIDSWEGKGRSPSDADSPSRSAPPLDPFAEQAALQQLIDLGYLDPLSPDRQRALDAATAEYNYNCGCSLMHAGRSADAVVRIELAHAFDPQRLGVALSLADCYLKCRRFDDCRRLVDYIAAGNCFETGLEDRSKRIGPQLDMIYGLLEFGLGNLESAHAHLLKAEQAADRNSGVHAALGDLYLQMKKFDDAARAMSAALAIDPDDLAALNGMTVIHLDAGRDDLAISCALHSLELLYHQPRVHYLLGLAMKRNGNLKRATEAMEISLRMDPRNPDAAKQLEWLRTAPGAGSD